MKTCYASAPMGMKPSQDGQPIDFNKIYFDVIKPAVESLNVKCLRADELQMGGVIQKAVFSAVINSDIMIADITGINPNVMYELGVRHSFRRNNTILISAASQRIPFDLSFVITHQYQLTPENNLSEEEGRALRNKIIKAIEEGSRGENTSPLYEFFPELNIELPKKPCVFIGHGRSKLWARVQIFLQNDLGLNTVTYESKSRTSESIVAVLEQMLKEATFAILVLTAEDKTAEKTKRARQNVIHESGLFQGALGFNKAIVLRQEGLEDFSNIAGLQYINFTGENIEQTFYEVQRKLKKEGMLV